MEFNLFGLKLGGDKKDPSKSTENLKKSFVLPQSDDDALNVEASAGFFSTYIDMDGTHRTDADLIYKYREMSMHPECELAIEDVVCEAIVSEENLPPVKIALEDVELSSKVKKQIVEEFNHILKLLEFKTKGYEIFRRWYIDSKVAYHKIIDEKNPSDGLIELRYIDPVNLQKVRQFEKKKNSENVTIVTKVEEYYVYNKDGFKGGATQGLRISPDAVSYITSGLFDYRSKRVVGYMHKAIKALNQLRMMEDAIVIYRICLVGDTRIKTNNGYKYIKNINAGDVVFSFNTDGLFETTVNKSWSNGIKDVYKVKSQHHEITGTENHPILVYDAMTKEVGYVDIKDIDPDIHYFVYEKPKDSGKNISFNFNVEPHVKLNNYEIFANLVIESKEEYIKTIAKELELKTSTVRNFLYGTQFISKSDSRRILDKVGISNKSILEERTSGNYRNSINLPEFIDTDFAQLFGFLLGDGSVSKNGISFAEGIDSTQNQKYADLLIKYFGNCTRTNSTTRTYSNWHTNNTNAANLMRSLGFITGSKNKRIPEWVFQASDEVKTAFIVGLCEADGHIKINLDKGQWNCTLSLCNQKLIEDTKEVWTSIGMSSGHITHRIRKATTRIIGDEPKPRTMPQTESWSVFLSTNPLQHFEKIWSVEHAGQEEVFDVEVASEKHNFVANGVVVHNSRAPERRIFYIDVGSLPKNKAEQYMRDLMNRHRNKLQYDSASGEIRDDRRHMSILEDYWLPRREGGQGTKIETLEGGKNLSDIEDVRYFLKKLYKSMNVPLSRMDGEQKSFSIGKSTEITRDEVKFSKFIDRLRTKFSELFFDILRTQLLLKNIITVEDWETIKDGIFFTFSKDTYFAEMKENEVLNEKFMVASTVQPFMGTLVSRRYVQKVILGLSDEEIEEMEEEIEEERKQQEADMLAAAGQMGMPGMGDPMGGGMPPMAGGGSTPPDSGAGGMAGGGMPPTNGMPQL